MKRHVLEKGKEEGNSGSRRSSSEGGGGKDEGYNKEEAKTTMRV